MENIEDIKNGKKISNSLTNELYLYNNILYKIFNNLFDIEKKELLLKKLYNNPIKDCSNIYNFLYEDELIGYGMEYYNNYIPLKKIKKIPFEYKKIYAHKLIEIYNKLKELGYIYYDFHGDNILVNKDELKLIDIDNCLLNNEFNNKLGTRILSEMIVSILFDCKFFDYQVYFYKDEQEKIIDILFSGLNDGYNKINLNELNNYIEDLTKKDIKIIKKYLPKNILK